MGHDLNEIARRKSLGLAAIKEKFGTEGDEYGVTLFVSHQLEEVEPEYWMNHVGTDTPTPAQVLELLVLKSHWGVDEEGEIDDDGIETFDFTLPAEVTDYVLTVKFDEDGEIVEIDMES